MNTTLSTPQKFQMGIPLTDEEIKNFKAEPKKFADLFATLNEKDEYAITSSLMDYLLFVGENLENKFTQEEIYQYYLTHVTKSPHVENILREFQVLVDTREYIRYYFKDRRGEHGESLNHIFAMQKAVMGDIDERIRHYFRQYGFVPEVDAIIQYCSTHYPSIKEIPEQYKPRIIRKIETTLFLKNAPKSILETFS